MTSVFLFPRQREDGSTRPPLPSFPLALFRHLCCFVTVHIASPGRFLWDSCGLDGLLLLVALACYPPVLSGTGVFSTFLLPLGLVIFFSALHVSPLSCHGEQRPRLVRSTDDEGERVHGTTILNSSLRPVQGTGNTRDESCHGSRRRRKKSFTSIPDSPPRRHFTQEQTLASPFVAETLRSVGKCGQHRGTWNSLVGAYCRASTLLRRSVNSNRACSAVSGICRRPCHHTALGSGSESGSCPLFPFSASFGHSLIPAAAERLVLQGSTGSGVKENGDGRLSHGPHSCNPSFSHRADDSVLISRETCEGVPAKRQHFDGTMRLSTVNSLPRTELGTSDGRRLCISSKVVGTLLVPACLGSCILYIQENGLPSLSGKNWAQSTHPCCFLWFMALSDLVPCLAVGSVLGTALWTAFVGIRQLVKIVFVWVVVWHAFFDVYPARLLSETATSFGNPFHGSWVSLALPTALPDVSVAVWIVLKGMVSSFFIFLQLFLLRVCSSRAGACFSFVEAMVVSQLSATAGFLSIAHCLLLQICDGQDQLLKLCSSLSGTPGWLVFVSHMFSLLAVGIACGLVFYPSPDLRCSPKRKSSTVRPRRRVCICTLTILVGLYLVLGQDPDLHHRKKEGLPLAASPLSWLLCFVFSDSRNASLFLFWCASSLIGIWLITLVQTRRTLARGKKWPGRGSETRLVITRKMFHLLLVSNVFVGLLWGAYELVGLVLCGLVWLLVFCEVLRLSRVLPRLSDCMNGFFTYFMDCRDQNGVFLTHIYLAVGVTLPFIATALSSSGALSVRHLIGLILVGVGDGAAAVAGVVFGGRRFPLASKKTVAGVIGFLAAGAAVGLTVAANTWGIQEEVRCFCLVRRRIRVGHSGSFSVPADVLCPMLHSQDRISDRVSILWAVGISSLFEVSVGAAIRACWYLAPRRIAPQSWETSLGKPGLLRMPVRLLLRTQAYTSDVDNLTLPLFGLIAYDNAVRLHRPELTQAVQ